MPKATTAKQLNKYYAQHLAAIAAPVLHQINGKKGFNTYHRLPMRMARDYVQTLIKHQAHVLPRGKAWWRIARREGITNALFGGWFDNH